MACYSTGVESDFASSSSEAPDTKATSIETDQFVAECPRKGGRVCNDQGSCVGGRDEPKRCACYASWFGVACHLKHCPNSVHKTSQHGTNQHTRVVYHAGTGFDGGLASPSDFIECSAHGMCHHEPRITGRGKLHGTEDRGVAGTCECVHPFFGDDCSQHVCPVYEGAARSQLLSV